jgi:PBP1b-binding outer membrane lipoprotein LpoB
MDMSRIFILVLVAALLLAGCASQGTHPAQNQTDNQTEGSKPVNSSSGGQIVDVGQSIPVRPD